MRTKNFYRNILLILALPVFFFSCNEEPVEQEFELKVDSYIVKKKIDDELMFAKAYFAYGTKAIESATVTPPDLAGSQIELESSESTPTIFYKEPEMGDYTNMYPAQGEYVFDVESKEGEVLQEADMMEAGALEVPEITEAIYHSDVQSMTVSWDSAQDANGFVVKLLNQNHEVIFVSYTLIASADEYEINQASGNWDGTAYSGDDYILQIQAFTYESSATEDNKLYNIKEVAIGEKEIKWGS
jgi:hypothetical protein